MTTNIEELQQKASIVRETIIELSYRAKSAHLGSGLSCAELVLYFLLQKKNKELDKFILSKGHAAMALYSAANVLELISDEHLKSYLQDNTDLWGHPSYNNYFKSFIDWSSGSLGHGLPVCLGFSYLRKIEKRNGKIGCILSDGELNEGSNWEAILFAGHHKLNNLVIAVDYNKIQSYGTIQEVLNLEPLNEKFKAFNWEVKEIDGHNINQIHNAFNTITEKPLVIIAHTIKGKGIPHLENTLSSHYKPASESDLKRKRLS